MPSSAATAHLHERLDTGLNALKLKLTDVQCGRLIEYIQHLAQWNAAYNLTAVRDPLEMVGRHLLDSLAVSSYITQGPVLDLGTGAGLPGIPLAIAHPELDLVLLDSVGKKIRFVQHVVAQLGLENVTVVQARAEAYQPAQQFAIITARAMADLSVLCAHVCRLRQPQARLLAFKGRYPQDELSALSACAGDVRLHLLNVPFVVGERHLVEIYFNSK